MAIKKPDFFLFKKRFEKTYPVFIAITSSILAFFSFLFQFHDNFEGWNIILVASIIFLLSVIGGAVLTYCFFILVMHRTLAMTKGPYTVIESSDSCEFSTTDTTKTKYRRTERIIVDVDQRIPIYYRLPTVNPGRIENVQCMVNDKLVTIHEEIVHSDIYYFHTHDSKMGREIVRTWEWDAINVYREEDDIKITSSPLLEKCSLKLVIPKPSNQLKAEWYVYYYHDHVASFKDELLIPPSEGVSVIENDFSRFLDGGVYKFGIHWKKNEG